MFHRFTFGRDSRVNALLGAGHFLSHFYQLCLPPLFIAWQRDFGASFAELGLAMAVMAAAAALMQTPMGFLVDRYGARPFLVSGTLMMTLSIAAMGLATAYWQVVGLALLSGAGNSVIHPADYAILSGSVDRARLGRSFAFHTFAGNLGFAAVAGGAGAGLRMARRAALRRTAWTAPGADDYLAESHSGGSSAAAATSRTTNNGGRQAAVV